MRKVRTMQRSMVPALCLCAALLGGCASKVPPPSGAGDSPRARVDSAPARVVQEYALPTSQAALRPHLTWLRDHQSADGSWCASGDSSRAPITRKRADAAPAVSGPHGGGDIGPVGLTSLELLAFAGDGCAEHPEFADSVWLGLRFLADQRLIDGSFAGVRTLREHALATMALCACGRALGDSRMKQWGRESAECLLLSRQGGWGEHAGAVPNLVDTCYALMAIDAARESGLRFEHSELDDVRAFVLSLRRADGSISWSHAQPSAERGPMLAAVWVIAATLGGAAIRGSWVLETAGAQITHSDALPAWRAGGRDFECWWISSRALTLLNSSGRKAWRASLAEALLPNQRGWTTADRNAGHTATDQLSEMGSWDPHQAPGGRTAATCFAALSLQSLGETRIAGG